MEAFDNKDDPKITIRLIENQSKQTISIEDNGIGINNNLIKDIFIPFFTTKKEGTGIGLYYSKLIVLMHKGTLKVSSVPEKGSVFTIQL